MTQCTALIMAAGFARRFGSDKRRALLPNGRALIEQVLDTITGLNIDVYVVTRDLIEPQNSAPVGGEQSADYLWRVPVITVPVESAQRGLGASIAAAARELSGNTSVLICLADMPYIRAETYRTIIDAIEPQGIAVPIFNGKRGHPVGFSADYLVALSDLDGDEGARRLLWQFHDQVKEVVVNDAFIHRDIDTPADLLAAPSSLDG